MAAILASLYHNLIGRRFSSILVENTQCDLDEIWSDAIYVDYRKLREISTLMGSQTLDNLVLHSILLRRQLSMRAQSNDHQWRHSARLRQLH